MGSHDASTSIWGHNSISKRTIKYEGIMNRQTTDVHMRTAGRSLLLAPRSTRGRVWLQEQLGLISINRVGTEKELWEIRLDTAIPIVKAMRQSGLSVEEVKD